MFWLRHLSYIIVVSLVLLFLDPLRLGGHLYLTYILYVEFWILVICNKNILPLALRISTMGDQQVIKRHRQSGLKNWLQKQIRCEENSKQGSFRSFTFFLTDDHLSFYFFYKFCNSLRSYCQKNKYCQSLVSFIMVFFKCCISFLYPSWLHVYLLII